MRRLRQRLGDAYDRVGRIAEARAILKASLDEHLAKEPPDAQTVLNIRGRWGQFVLDHSRAGDADFTAAEVEFLAVVEKAADRRWLEPALAHAGLARIGAARGDRTNALNESRLALVTLERVQALYDLRYQPEFWLVHSAVLRQSGDVAGARQWAEKALEASRRYDHPSADSIKQAKAAVRAATAVSIKR